jgi:hypothetical protein
MPPPCSFAQVVKQGSARAYTLSVNPGGKRMRTSMKRLLFAGAVVMTLFASRPAQAYVICENLNCISVCVFYDDAGKELRRNFIPTHCSA